MTQFTQHPARIPQWLKNDLLIIAVSVAIMGSLAWIAPFKAYPAHGSAGPLAIRPCHVASECQLHLGPARYPVMIQPGPYVRFGGWLNQLVGHEVADD